MAEERIIDMLQEIKTRVVILEKEKDDATPGPRVQLFVQKTIEPIEKAVQGIERAVEKQAGRMETLGEKSEELYEAHKEFLRNEQEHKDKEAERKSVTPQAGSAPFVAQYLVTGVFTGIYGTEQNAATHQDGDYFMLVDSAVKPFPMRPSDVTAAQTFFGQSVGQALADAKAVSSYSFTRLAAAVGRGATLINLSARTPVGIGRRDGRQHGRAGLGDGSDGAHLVRLLQVAGVLTRPSSATSRPNSGCLTSEVRDATSEHIEAGARPRATD